jgi:hypothetical protein
MPVIRKPASGPNKHELLVDALKRELQRNRKSGPRSAPIVVEEEVRGSRNLHVTVIWDRWEGIAPEDRGQVILDAYSEGRGADEMLRVSVALGLTHEEAKRLGVSVR